jgi:hypothetical protein
LAGKTGVQTGANEVKHNVISVNKWLRHVQQARHSVLQAEKGLQKPVDVNGN